MDTIYLAPEILARYTGSALRVACPRQIEDGTWFADLGEAFPGVWADEDSPQACMATLAEVLQDWLILKLADGDRDIPILDGIDWTVAAQRK